MTKTYQNFKTMLYSTKTALYSSFFVILTVFLNAHFASALSFQADARIDFYGARSFPNVESATFFDSGSTATLNETLIGLSVLSEHKASVSVNQGVIGVYSASDSNWTQEKLISTAAGYWSDAFTITSSNGLPIPETLKFTLEVDGAFSTPYTSDGSDGSRLRISAGIGSKYASFEYGDWPFGIAEPTGWEAYRGPPGFTGTVSTNIGILPSGKTPVNWSLLVETVAVNLDVEADFTNTANLAQILLADGSTPESKGFYLAFDSGMSSPNIAPVPEPSTMLLLAAGLVGLAGLGRKKFFKE